MSAVLAVNGLSSGHAGLRVVRGLDLEVGAGEVAALLGANGAGKSTTLAAIAGVLPIAEGDVAIDGRSVRGLPAHAIARMGVALVPDDRGLFAQLTVAENMRLSRTPSALERAAAHFPALEGLADRRAGVLSGGEQQMLALARGLVRGPRLLMVDELSLGLAPIVVTEILRTLRRIATANGTAILLVEQHVQLALAVADRAYVLSRGELALAGSAAEVARRRDLVEASYLGRDAT